MSALYRALLRLLATLGFSSVGLRMSDRGKAPLLPELAPLHIGRGRPGRRRPRCASGSCNCYARPARPDTTATITGPATGGLRTSVPPPDDPPVPVSPQRLEWSALMCTGIPRDTGLAKCGRTSMHPQHPCPEPPSRHWRDLL